MDQTDAIPHYFINPASTAVTAAISILELILKDDDLRNSLVGVPHYFHTMIAFAGVVLLKASGKYHAQLSIDLESIFNLTSRVISLFRSTACSIVSTMRSSSICYQTVYTYLVYYTYYLINLFQELVYIYIKIIEKEEREDTDKE